ncbi:hypothetical protein FOG51_01382 [Hanseniaspora uvarum]|uniref:60S acidic ribosomal protein P2 n=1 Tax=Hanseniaspora uvarum TaxID=29833 RepID=A0A1E5RPD8_HANUV|nr:hypothetical protein FOG48_04092 [Hanseniaspora uvarum]KKA02544.1 60S acidic ribosomal protein P2-alpha [Hanseniaspora uvarum DSM 2768]KAF0273811.1 hypothetical protein FOG51_01382 [Hanseniaspora uvarum]KAF0277590.1 hypothetical protein FOG50_01568 [Hanseniaspora uvarum]OEJ88746.1 60S acidic ribosomal protein P2 [Hanseniaspora uvarum]
MKYLAAYLLLTAAGKTPSVESISAVVAASGVEADAAQIEALIAKLEGKTVEELVAAGNEKLSSVPVGAAAPSGAAASGSTEAAAEEKEASEAEESDDDMGFGLFD